MASASTHHFYPNKLRYSSKSSSFPSIVSCKEQQDENNKQVGRRDIILRSSEIAVLGAIFNFSGKKPNYLGVQKNPLGLALCPATNNCVSTSENISDATHYAPPWNYNPEGKRGNVSREKAMEELLQVLKSTKPDKSSPKIVERKDDYVRVEYESPILGLVDDVEFWFPPGQKSVIHYRAASRLGNYDFDANRKRIKVMCLADLENDYVNPYDSASEVNIIVVPEFVLQGALCFLHLVMGHWSMCLVCLPYLYYDVKVYIDRRHLLDVTEIFNQLPWEKKIRLYKLGYLGILLGFSVFCMVWSIVAE